jgi:hypothetical protein
MIATRVANSQVRHFLTFLGGYLSATGKWEGLDFQEIAALLATILGAGLSIYDKVQSYRAARARARQSSASGVGSLLPLLLLFGLVALALSQTGCRSIARLTSARIEIVSGTNRLSVIQPKDTVFKKLEFNPATGAIEVSGYSSAANAAAVEAQRAQSEAIANAITQTFSAAQDSAQKAFSAYMGNISALRSAPPETVPTPKPPAAAK